MSAQSVTNWFFTLYKRLGYEGCSSHSGRRTAITRWSRKISSVGGSLRDVQSLARHSPLQMTQRYIEVSEDAMKKVVGQAERVCIGRSVRFHSAPFVVLTDTFTGKVLCFFQLR